MKHLSELRKRAGLTQVELATLTRINRSRLVYAEGGYQLSPAEDAKIFAVINKAIEENTASVRRVMADRVGTVATT